MQLTVIQRRIYEVRGVNVMLDFDLAALYHTETKYLKRSVRQNMKRFPPDFMFELTKEEYDSLRCKISTLNDTGVTNGQSNVSKQGKHSKYPPFVFTEHGVVMLASVLNSDKAIEMNIDIVRAFISLRQLAIEHKDFTQQLKNLRTELHERIDVHDAQLGQIYEALENMLDTEAEKKAKEDAWRDRKRIGYK
ncbi:MAG: ORF6N domain-containing protein [Niabella sp.]|nr:ORF6N domain-containing protein [Niabella sp.]